MGIKPKEHPEWLVHNGGICEGCGYNYLNENDEDKKNKRFKYYAKTK